MTKLEMKNSILVGAWTESLFLGTSLFINYKGKYVRSLGIIVKLVIKGQFYTLSWKIKIFIYEVKILRGDIA